MLQISSYWTPGDALRIQLNPEQNFFQRLKDTQAQHPKLSVQHGLGRWLPKRFVQHLIKPKLLQKNLAQCQPADFKAISHQLEHWIIKPNNTEGYRTAEVTLGGVDCNDLSSKTMQANKVPGLFFIGEVVDVTGWLGGYNFQWAWASAVAAANAL